MSYLYTADDLITDVQGRAMLATSSNTLTTADYLRFINDEIQSYIVPFVMSTREEFFVTYQDLTVVSGTASYAIPTRAIGSKLRDVLLSYNNTFTQLPRIEPERVSRSGTIVTGTPEGYYIEGNNVVLFPTPSVGLTLRLKYFIRPNRVVSLSSTGTVSSVTTTTATIASVPTAWVAGATNYDVVKGTPHYECRGIDQSATLATATLTFTAVPTGTVAGDYVCLAGESPVPQIPVELHPLLAERVVVRALTALGDPKADGVAGSAEMMKKNLTTVLTSRAEGSSRYAINFNAPGWRGRRFSRRGN